MRFVQKFIDELANTSVSGIGVYETQAATRVSVAQYISKRYGCDRITGHHKRASCLLSGRIDYLSRKLEKTTDPNQRKLIVSQLQIWKRKQSDELVRPKFRKFD